MRKLLSFLLAAALRAAVIRGTVVEHSTGKPLARANVSVMPLPGTNGGTVAARTNTFGSFEFDGLPAGAYIVTAARRGFPPMQYGQKNFRASGTPVVVEADQSTFLTLRMPRYGAITGIVVDENDVGIPEHEVVAYRNTRPPRLVNRVSVDDRGVFRIPGLDPGRYLVRTVGRQYEDGGYLPTFYHDTARVEEASYVEVDLDRETPDAKIRPFPGHLYNIGGVVSTTPIGTVVTLSLVSDVGRETISTAGDFQFPAKPPGPYELWATAPGFRGTSGLMGAFVPLALENHELSGLRISLLPAAGVSFNFRGPQGQPIDPTTVKMQMRRVDLAGEGPVEPMKLNNGSAQFVQGRYQLQILPNSAYVALDFRGPKGERPDSGRADGWNEIVVTGPCGVTYTLSTKPAGVHGVVTTDAHTPVPGAPVFLEPWDTAKNRRIMEPRMVRADMHGQYAFVGLAPGTYRLASTFEYQSPESTDIDVMTPRMFIVEEGRDQQQDLDLYVVR
jgi:hypothetical protein